MKNIYMIAAMLMCIAISSCTNDDEFEVTGKSESEITEKFKAYFYDESGQVKLNQIEGFTTEEWVCVSSNGIRPVEVFADITGEDVAMPNGKYEYKFVSSDGRCKISIKGNTEADNNAIYAVMQVDIPDCSDVKTIYIGSLDYSNRTNEYGQNQEANPANGIGAHL